ncbi:hypothetical protein TNCV_3014031 [Trichonephila clavipes]|nr:hypothetical protein TNCV_3014031 [Trichonephila clavipes]
MATSDLKRSPGYGNNSKQVVLSPETFVQDRKKVLSARSQRRTMASQLARGLAAVSGRRISRQQTAYRDWPLPPSRVQSGTSL